MKTKLKTHKSTVKRFKVSPSGKVRHNKQGDNSHMKIKKSHHQKQRLAGKSDIKSVKQANKLKGLMLAR